MVASGFAAAPACSTRAVANATAAGSRSTPSTLPTSPTTRAASMATSPAPEPRSSTRIPGPSPAARNTRPVSGSNSSARRSRRSCSSPRPAKMYPGSVRSSPAHAPGVEPAALRLPPELRTPPSPAGHVRATSRRTTISRCAASTQGRDPHPCLHGYQSRGLRNCLCPVDSSQRWRWPPRNQYRRRRRCFTR